MLYEFKFFIINFVVFIVIMNYLVFLENIFLCYYIDRIYVVRIFIFYIEYVLILLCIIWYDISVVWDFVDFKCVCRFKEKLYYRSFYFSVVSCFFIGKILD